MVDSLSALESRSYRLVEKRRSAPSQKDIPLEVPLGQLVVSLLYPRLNNENPAIFTPLANGKGVEVVIPAGTDYVFLSRKPFGFRNGEISFKGKAGVIQLCGKKVLLTLNQAGEISYRNNRLTTDKPST